MKGFLWFVIGLVIGLAAMWLYGNYVMAPQIETETSQRVTAAVEEEKIAQTTRITGVVSKSNEDIGPIVVATDGAEITVKFDEKTMIYRLDGSSAEGRARIGAGLIGPGDTVTIISNAPVAGQTSIYATEIIRL